MSNSLRVRSRSAPSTVTMRVSGFSRTPWCSSHADARGVRSERLGGWRGRDVVAGAAQHRVDARAQLARPERLGDVVVGAGLESLKGVDLLGARAEHHDVRRAHGADALGSLEAVHAGHVDIEGRDERLVLVERARAPSSPVPAPYTVNPACARTADRSDRMSSSSSITTATRASSTVAPSGADESIAGARTSVRISQNAVWNLRSVSVMPSAAGCGMAIAPTIAIPPHREQIVRIAQHVPGTSARSCGSVEPQSRVHLPSHVLPQTLSEDPLSSGCIRRYDGGLKGGSGRAQD